MRNHKKFNITNMKYTLKEVLGIDQETFGYYDIISIFMPRMELNFYPLSFVEPFTFFRVALSDFNLEIIIL